ncbi:MAG: hypothetical protein RL215_927 [Planctomycetota bacterium]
MAGGLSVVTCGSAPASLAVVELSLPAEFAVERSVVAVARESDEFECLGGALDEDFIGGGEGAADLAVDHEHDSGGGFVDSETIGAVGGVDDGAYGERMRADGCDGEDLEFLAEDGAAGRQVVSGGAYGGGDDQSIAAEGGDLFVIDAEVDVEHFE